MKYTDLDRIVEQIEQIPWSDDYIWRDQIDFINFVRKFESKEVELEAELDSSEGEYGLLEDRYDSLQEDYDGLDADYSRLYDEHERLKEENLKLKNEC